MVLEKADAASGSEPLLKVVSLKKRYFQGPLFARKRFHVVALDDLNLALQPRSTLAVVGESGAGKSTLARCLALLEKPDSGEIWLDGRNLLALRSQELFAARGRLQLIFQDSATALNPRFSAVELIEEPLRIRTHMPKKERREVALEMMERVGLSPLWAERSPFEFSGGQRQRLAIARALVVKPGFLILDEALSGLDLSIQAQIANLLLEIQAAFSLAYLLITHDIRLAAYFADEIAVMRSGRIIESGCPSVMLPHAEAFYTRVLMAAIPRLQTDSANWA
jgi:ABC-type glutathione transport system ATPase component